MIWQMLITLCAIAYPPCPSSYANCECLGSLALVCLLVVDSLAQPAAVWHAGFLRCQGKICNSYQAFCGEHTHPTKPTKMLCVPVIVLYEFMQ